MSKMIDSFTNRYSLSKTLRFKLIPVGKTEENFKAKQLLEQDEKRAESYKKVKAYMDRYHKAYIESVLSGFVLNGVKEYAELYYKSGKTDAELNLLEKAEEKMRKQIAGALKSDERYSLLSKKEFITKLLPEYLTDEEEIATTAEFAEFSTYFSGFFQNRANMYSDMPQTTAIAYRCINENLPKFLDNVKSFEKIKSELPQKDMDSLALDFSGLCGTDVADMFSIDYFSFVLSQSGIESYNRVLGGYTNTDGTKVQGINEYVNLYNQQVAKNDRSKRLPLIKPLFKQILSDRESISFIPEEFKDDNELLNSVYSFYNGNESTAAFKETLDGLNKIFAQMEMYDMNGVYLSSGLALTEISNRVFGTWDAVERAWNAEYETTHTIKNGKEEKFYDEEKKAFKRIKSFSVNEIERLCGSSGAVSKYFAEKVKECTDLIDANYTAAFTLLSSPYKAEKRLSANEAEIEKLKNLLDSIKELEKTVKSLLGTGKEEEKDNSFYGDFEKCFAELSVVDKLYDRVRNYLTKKPYADDKIKLNFENPQFLGGWPYTKETDYSAFILLENGNYYLAVMDAACRSQFKKFKKPENAEDSISKMFYYQLADPSKDVPNLMVINGKTEKKNGRKDADGVNRLLEQLRCQYLPEKINQIRLSRSFSKTSENFSASDLEAYIEYYQQRVKKYYSGLEFEFKPASEYKSFAEFTDHIDSQAYQVWFEYVSKSQIFEWVDNGSLYLFKIYNKDFSENSHGTPNLHTLYFKMLFDERNLADVVYKLNGQCEMFYRKASINENEKIVHPANQPIANKNPDNPKKTSEFTFDMVKDKRYTVDQFSLHIPVTMNFKAEGEEYINNSVRKKLLETETVNVIGIDRGERNLIYVTVVNGNGEILEQHSLNEIVGDMGYTVDYHKLLDNREADRDKARKDWKSIGNIKELKEGYLSQAIHEICKLVVKYDAVIAMEDLNSGFMNSRKKVEKQVYQKFEKMLTDKLNYLVDKKADAAEIGGLLNAYQLTNKATTSRKLNQDGIIFYIPAWLTSKIDPTTGFVNLFNTRWESAAAAKEFIGKFKSVCYNPAEDIFEFSFDYSAFERTAADYRKHWTVCSNGERIRTFRNPAKNNEFDNERVNLTSEFKKLFEEYKIDIFKDIKNQLVENGDTNLLREFMKIFALTVQMRNSITGTSEDYLISPVKNSSGEFYDSRTASSSLPCDADANGAYNIARKALWAINAIKTADDYTKAKISISNADWLEFAQK